MSFDTVIHGGTSGTGADVDANKQLLVTTNSDSTKAGAVVMFTENDSGAFTGTRFNRSPETSQDFRLRVGTATATETFLWVISPNLYHE